MSEAQWLTCSTTSAYLSSVDEVLVDWTKSEEPELNEIVQQLVKMGGKKVRPSLLLLAGSFGSRFSKELIYPAAAIELMHVASLYHDDVMDQAEVRRSTPSVNAAWGNSIATYGGLYVFSKAIALLAKTGSDVNKMVCRSVSDLCLGQLKESENAYNIDASEAEHLDAIQRKTAALFELPCNMGARLAGAKSEVVNALTSYGLNLGMSFQLTDDLLDLQGTPEEMGKSAGTDLREGIYSYAVIMALNNPEQRDELVYLLMLDQISDDEILRVLDLVAASDAIQKAREKALDYANLALESIAALPDTVAKKSLQNLGNYMVHRNK
jgi:heptaprenyl diphosphate synthase